MKDITLENVVADLVGIDTRSISKTNRVSTVAINDYIDAYLQKIGFSLIQIGTGNKNIIAKNKAAIAADANGERYYCLCGHLDTVNFEAKDWKTDPFKLVEIDGNLYGLGSADMKGPVACMLKAAEEVSLIDANIPISFLLTHGEEVGLLGAKEISESESARKELRNANMIIGEPTRLELGYSHRGFYGFDLEITGKTAHTSIPSDGKNAIYAAAKVSSAIENLNYRLNKATSADYPNGCTISLGIINGGIGRNKVCPTVILQGDMRLIPGKDYSEFQETISELKQQLGKEGFGLDVIIDCDDKPLYTSPNSGFIQNLARISGKTPSTLTYATDASYLSSVAGIPCAIIGPGDIKVCHKPNEFMPKEQLYQGLTLYKNILLSQKK